MEQPAQAKLAVSCLILAGGQGRRLTPDKPLLKIAGRPIIERTAEVARSLFAEVIVVTNTPAKYEFLGLPLVADQRQGCGPLMGIYSGMSLIRHELAFVCAADMPFLDERMIRLQHQETAGFDIVAPSPGGRPEFLHAFYRRCCLPAMGDLLAAGVYKIQALAQGCQTLLLDEDWFARLGLDQGISKAFANINTLEDYSFWRARQGAAEEDQGARPAGLPDALQSIMPQVWQQARQTLIEQETAYQQRFGREGLSSLWAHSARVGRIAHYLALREGLEPEPALLAGLLHDTGKFAHGSYHEDDVPEEQKALEFVERILTDTPHQRWLGEVSQAILTMYQDQASSDIGRAVYDADNLDKLGYLGVAQFFAKNALRRRFLDDDLIVRASVELTYAQHAQQTLKTATGRALAEERSLRTRRFYTELVSEWAQVGLGEFDILEEDIGGVLCTVVVPRVCPCGGRLRIATDISDALKCRSVVVRQHCLSCGQGSQYSFCLPNIQGLPPRRG